MRQLEPQVQGGRDTTLIVHKDVATIHRNSLTNRSSACSILALQFAFHVMLHRPLEANDNCMEDSSDAQCEFCVCVLISC